MSPRMRTILLVAIDLVATTLVVFAGLWMRFALDGRAIPSDYLQTLIKSQYFTIPLRLAIYALFGLYRQAWRYASIPELLRIVGAVTVDSMIATVITLALSPGGFPRSVLVMSWLMKMAALGSIRLGLRMRAEWYALRRHLSPDAHATLIFGAGDAGAILAREYAKHPEIGANIIGFVDDDPNKRGMQVAGRPVLGTREDLPALVAKHKITHLVIAMPSAKACVIREILQAGLRLGLHVKTLPGIYELANGSVSVNQIRDVQIEDLLGREEVKVDMEAIAGYLTDEVVLVTGAGGSIGSELCRQVARFQPRKLLLLGHGENSIYEIDLELRTKFPGVELQPIIADIQDETRIRRVFEQYRPGVVFHAAAHKHVPLMEANPEEAIKNNVFGTLNVARAADSYRAKRFVLISSDKAVNPTSVMGATKRAAEYVIQSFAQSSKTVFVAVRFGNVLGSRGSVIPLFQRQIAAGGPVTITDPKMVRYFMTIPEASQLVIQAASMGKGGEVFVLDMGKPVRIIDLARDLIRLSGFEPDMDIPIVATGIRPGEKLFEELLTAEEGTQATKHERIYVARPDHITVTDLEEFLQQLSVDMARGQTGNERLRSAVDELPMKAKVAYRGIAGAGY